MAVACNHFFSNKLRVGKTILAICKTLEKKLKTHFLLLHTREYPLRRKRLWIISNISNNGAIQICFLMLGY